MRHLQILAGPLARQRIAQAGLQRADIRAVAAAAGGPKGLVLNALDRHLFGRWLAGEGAPLHLVGVSIGAWRLACGALADADAALARMAQSYVHENYDPPRGERQSARNIGACTEALIGRIFGGAGAEALAHPRFRLHLVADRACGPLQGDRPALRHAGFALLVAANALSRRNVGRFLERTVFSDPRAVLPLALSDLPTRRAPLLAQNLQRVILASGSIPFWMPSVRAIPGALPGAYWDGGMSDYHLHWEWTQLRTAADPEALVLYPHYEARLIPGWLDKSFPARHRTTPGLANVVLLAPTAQWQARLPLGKLPDRHDFMTWRDAPQQRIAHWQEAIKAGEDLVEDFEGWIARGCPVDEVGAL